MFYQSSRGCKKSVFILNTHAGGLDLGTLRLGLAHPPDRSPRWLGGFARFGRFGHAVDQLMQANQRVKAVHLLGTVLLRLEHQYAVLVDTAVMQRQQPRLDIVRQTRRSDVKAQMDGAGHLVDVLAARALGPNGTERHLVFAYMQGLGHGNLPSTWPTEVGPTGPTSPKSPTNQPTRCHHAATWSGACT